jgi:hypothetical protein
MLFRASLTLFFLILLEFFKRFRLGFYKNLLAFSKISFECIFRMFFKACNLHCIYRLVFRQNYFGFIAKICELKLI